MEWIRGLSFMVLVFYWKTAVTLYNCQCQESINTLTRREIKIESKVESNERRKSRKHQTNSTRIKQLQLS